MALIGNWGDFTFYVSADQIKTFDSLKWDSAAKYSTHDRHLREPLLEYTGTDVETITFTMFFSVFFGGKPYQRNCKPASSYAAGRSEPTCHRAESLRHEQMGHYELSNSLKRSTDGANLLVASVNVTMQSYAVR